MMDCLPVKLACELDEPQEQMQWLIEGLWTHQAVGILGGEPKCCKSFLALDMAVAVASGTPCLRHFHVQHHGPVLLFPAEDSLPVVRERLEGICATAGLLLADLPIHVITAHKLLLDSPEDRLRLQKTVEHIKPALLVLDPFIRLHNIDENAVRDVAPLLGYLRELQRTHGTAVLLVHHARKDAHNRRPGQALRGSSDLHGWGDSNLYVRKRRDSLLLSIEHRAAPSQMDLPMLLHEHGQGLALKLLPQDTQALENTGAQKPKERILNILQTSHNPLSVREIRKAAAMRAATCCSVLNSLLLAGQVHLAENKRYALTQHK